MKKHVGVLRVLGLQDWLVIPRDYLRTGPLAEARQVYRGDRQAARVGLGGRLRSPEFLNT